MRGRRATMALVGSVTLGMAGISSASAAPSGAGTCSGGPIQGTYSSLTVTGDCTVPTGSTLIVKGNVMIAANASLNAGTSSTVRIGGNVVAGAGSSFALGCTEAHPCDGGGSPSSGSVGGNVILNHVFNAAINGSTIGGNLVSTGGGPGPSFPGFIPFSIKDDTIHGNVVVTGLSTIWFGVIRTHVGGNVVLSNIRGADPDSTEVVANTIGGNLVCNSNSPQAQFGDAVEDGPPGYGPNTVGGRAIGECAPLAG
jgi:hypothetical protein